MARNESKRDLRDGMWESRPGRSKTVKSADERDQERVNIDPNNPRYVRPGFSTQSQGQTTHQ